MNMSTEVATTVKEEAVSMSKSLFRVMRIVPDKQDYSFVEKVQLPEDEILSLCNNLVPASASVYSGDPPRTRINFSALDKLRLPAVGFYGDKKKMIQIFRKECLVGESALEQMEAKRFEPGFYVSVPQAATGILLVFYWHEGEHFKEASRKDMSCNFIRYLVELCHCVYVCVEGSYPFDALAASATNACSKSKRTRKIQVTSVKNSENDVEFLPGFKVSIDPTVKTQELSPTAPNVTNMAVVNGNNSVLFCEGYYRCCYLTTEYRVFPKTPTQIRSTSVKASELGKVLGEWSSVSNVDYSRLSNEHFISLLECCHSREYEAYCELMDKFKNNTSESATEAEKLYRCFLKVLPEFCSHVFLFLGGIPRFKDISSNLEKAEEKADEQHCNSDIDRFEQLHRELSMILAGDDGFGDGDHKVLLVESDVKFICSDAIADHMITLGSLEKGKQTLQFIRYGQEVKARCSSHCPCSKNINGKARFLRLKNGPKAFVHSGDEVKIKFSPTPAKSGDRPKTLVVEGVVRIDNNRSPITIRNWIDSMVPNELKSLERNIAFTAFLLSRDEHMALMFMERHLKTHDIHSLPTEFQGMFEKFQNEHPSQSRIDREALLSHDTLKAVCREVWENQEQMFLQNIKEGFSASVPKKKVDFNKGKEQKLPCKQTEDRFLRQLKEKLSSNSNDNLVTMYIVEVAIKRPSILSMLFYFERADQVELKFCVEERQWNIVWKACEMNPMKKDMIELISNPEHPLLPACGDAVELVTIIPGFESLFKVVFLKSGELIVFIHNFKESCVYLFHCPRLGVNINNMKPLHVFKRGYDLLSVDELTRSIALYDREQSKIQIYKFDESFRKVFWTGVEVQLGLYKGSKIITWMCLIPGKMELLLVNDTNMVRVVEIHEKPMIRAKQFSLSLPRPLSKACISVDGFFFVVFRESQTSGDVDVATERKGQCPGVALDVYVLGDIMSHLKTIQLNENVTRKCPNLDHLRVKITSFGPQSHLVIYNSVDAPGFLASLVFKTVLAREVVKYAHDRDLQAIQETEIGGQCPYLGYIYHIFDKFATTPALFPGDKKDFTFKVILESCTDPNNGEACIKYLEALIRQLKARREKDFSNIKLQFKVKNFEMWATRSICSHSLPTDDNARTKMGIWVRQLVCLVPIQIARAEKNGMVALKDGLQIPPNVSYVDSVSLANLMRFGFYDAVLNCWNGNIKVISSMGKQSSGKSYLLNHLCGSLLDVAGGRCTDGVWMTIIAREGDGNGEARCLYVLLDFEGLGSFERSEQEDMLLSVLNAAVSNLTIFNKKDFHLDKDTESAFSRFQSGISLVEQDKKLFKGLLYIAIKDVDASDVEDLMQEFDEKFYQICSKSQENFVVKMYGGKVEIATMAPYNRSEYYQQSLSELAQTVHRIDCHYDYGSTFCRDLKLIISQIAAKDWSPIDSKRVAVIVNILRRNLKCAVCMGSLSATNTDEVLRLVNFDTQKEVQDLPVSIGDLSSNISDTGLFLAPNSKNSIRDVLSLLRSTLESVLPRKGNNGESWHCMFEKFLEAIAERRRDRVQQWINTNTTDFGDNEEVLKLQLEATVALGEVKQGLSVCGCKCSECFWRCVLEKGHDNEHSCKGTHSCTERCTFCVREGDSFNRCRDLAGHEGPHHCKEINHTCRETCHLYTVSSNCNELCSLEPNHPGPHKCNSSRHMCKMTCSLPSCKNPCIVSIETSHEKHECHERYCPRKCTINGCSRSCGEKDHFHDLLPDSQHLCENDHSCPEECEMPGICEIITELVRQTRTFQGQRGSFEYEHVSEQNGIRKGCCIPIPRFQRYHDGPHIHTKNENAVHYCDTRCEACGYFCRLPLDHHGLHDTVHGNMKNVRFISEEEDIDIQDRKYKWGETGEAEMCNMYCRKQGRGHIHLVPCPIYMNHGYIKCTSQLYDGSRHQTVKYGPDVNVPKDEMTHDTYWKYVRFVDPCTEEEREEFSRCNHQCKSEEHDNAEAKASQGKSYCTKQLWHSPITRTEENASSTGYVTDDGHHFACHHSSNVPHHVIFVIDKSGSMGSSDITPTMVKFEGHNSRLGCVYEAILRFIQTRLRTVSDDSVSVVLFGGTAKVAVETQDMEESVVDCLLQHQSGGGTRFTSGLDCAEEILIKAGRDPKVYMKQPVVIFLSDGGDNGRGDPVHCVERLTRQEPRLALHTIMFGNDPQKNILQEMAKKGNGQFQLTLDGIELARSFENLAKSLKPRVAALMLGHGILA